MSPCDEVEALLRWKGDTTEVRSEMRSHAIYLRLLLLRQVLEGAMPLFNGQVHRPLDGSDYIRDLHRLGEIGVGARQESCELLVILNESAEDHERSLRGSGVAAQGADKLIPIDAGHADINHGTVGQHLKEALEPHRPIAGCDDLKLATQSQSFCQGSEQSRVVVHHQQPFRLR
jgi:N-acetylmuramoyl-L-alanine amidase